MTTAAHVHHFIVETPNGPTCKGECACGETRVYSSSGDDESTITMRAQKAKRGGARSTAQAVQFYGALAESSIGRRLGYD